MNETTNKDECSVVPVKEEEQFPTVCCVFTKNISLNPECKQLNVNKVCSPCSLCFIVLIWGNLTGKQFGKVGEFVRKQSTEFNIFNYSSKFINSFKNQKQLLK